MKLVQTIKALRDTLSSYQEKVIGFVPTMGALHQGHLSLIEESKKKTDITVCSIFVNPTQFNDKTDYEKYPVMPELDIKMLESVDCDILFMPTYNEIYADKNIPNYSFGNLEMVMEGHFRPGHFKGVAQIVSRLFIAVQPNMAFFGQKDFQQFVIIKNLGQQMQIPIIIESCPIIREANGLAMSSRNKRLSKEQKEQASQIYKILQDAQEMAPQKTPQEIKKIVEEKIQQAEGLDLEYFDIVNDKNLQSISSWQESCKKVACIAVFCGNVRLIDNIIFIL